MPKIRVNVSGADERSERLIKRAARWTYRTFRYPFLSSVDVLMTDNENIARINQSRRAVDAPTDVLSFPMWDFYEGQADPDLEADLDRGRVMLGDIVISYDMARKQALKYGHSYERECAYLTVHSMLHLLGFDHLDEGEEKEKMRQLEEKIMRVLRLERQEYADQ